MAHADVSNMQVIRKVWSESLYGLKATGWVGSHWVPKSTVATTALMLPVLPLVYTATLSWDAVATVVAFLPKFIGALRRREAIRQALSKKEVQAIVSTWQVCKTLVSGAFWGYKGTRKLSSAIKPLPTWSKAVFSVLPVFPVSLLFSAALDTLFNVVGFLPALSVRLARHYYIREALEVQLKSAPASSQTGVNEGQGDPVAQEGNHSSDAQSEDADNDVPPSLAEVEKALAEKKASAVTRIQKFFRKHLEEKPLEGTDLEDVSSMPIGPSELQATNEQNAAVRLQALVRMFQAKTQLKALREEKSLSTSAVKIQSIVRGCVAQKQAQDLREKAEQRQQENASAAATTLQKVVRGFLGKKSFRIAVLNNKVATKIQSLVRGFSAQKQVKVLKQDKGRATSIQTIVRSYLAKRKVGERKAQDMAAKQGRAASRIQAVARGTLERRRQQQPSLLQKAFHTALSRFVELEQEYKRSSNPYDMQDLLKAKSAFEDRAKKQEKHLNGGKVGAMQEVLNAILSAMELECGLAMMDFKASEEHVTGQNHQVIAQRHAANERIQAGLKGCGDVGIDANDAVNAFTAAYGEEAPEVQTAMEKTKAAAGTVLRGIGTFFSVVGQVAQVLTDFEVTGGADVDPKTIAFDTLRATDKFFKNEDNAKQHIKTIQGFLKVHGEAERDPNHRLHDWVGADARLVRQNIVQGGQAIVWHAMHQIMVLANKSRALKGLVDPIGFESEMPQGGDVFKKGHKHTPPKGGKQRTPEQVRGHRITLESSVLSFFASMLFDEHPKMKPAIKQKVEEIILDAIQYAPHIQEKIGLGGDASARQVLIDLDFDQPLLQCMTSDMAAATRWVECALAEACLSRSATKPETFSLRAVLDNLFFKHQKGFLAGLTHKHYGRFFQAAEKVMQKAVAVSKDACAQVVNVSDRKALARHILGRTKDVSEMVGQVAAAQVQDSDGFMQKPSAAKSLWKATMSLWRNDLMTRVGQEAPAPMSVSKDLASVLGQPAINAIPKSAEPSLGGGAAKDDSGDQNDAVWHLNG